MCVLVHLDLHTYTPCQLLIRASNRRDVCSKNRQNPRESNSTVMSKRKASTGRVNADLNSPVQRWKYCCRMQMCPFYSTMAISTQFKFSAYLFIHLQCSCSLINLFSSTCRVGFKEKNKPQQFSQIFLNYHHK